MSRKPTIIKITKYEKDPSRVGHKLEISSDIIASVKPKKQMKQNKNKHKQTSTRDILLQFMAKVEQFMVKQEQFNTKQEQFNAEQRQSNAKRQQFETKIETVIVLNNLRTE